MMMMMMGAGGAGNSMMRVGEPGRARCRRSGPLYWDVVVAMPNSRLSGPSEEEEDEE